MKTKATIFLALALLTLIAILGSCTKKDDTTITRQYYSATSGDTLKVNLGNFGIEEGATISQAPVHAAVSKLEREINSAAIIYKYLPVQGFTGIETVGIILNRGSNGASAGKDETLLISITVK